MTEATQLLQQANHNRAKAKRASFDSMAKKKRRKLEFSTVLDEDEGPVSFLFVSLSPTEYDELVAEHPPTEAQRNKDPMANVNADTFPPALLARVCKEPGLTHEQWLEIWKNENYGPGERASLYWQANNLCQQPLDLTPFGKG